MFLLNISVHISHHAHACSLSCVWLCDPVDCSLLGCSAHGILQARILEWVAISSSRGSYPPRDWTHISCIGKQILNHWASWGAPSIMDPVYILWRANLTSAFWFQKVSKSHLPALPSSSPCFPITGPRAAVPPSVSCPGQDVLSPSLHAFASPEQLSQLVQRATRFYVFSEAVRDPSDSHCLPTSKFLQLYFFHNIYHCVLNLVPKPLSHCGFC